MPPVGLVMNFGRNAEIYAEGETSGYVYKVLSGVVRVSKLLPDGRRQISAFHMPGEMFGFEAGEIHYASAEAVVPTKLIAFKWDGLLDVTNKQIGSRARASELGRDRAAAQPGSSAVARPQECAGAPRRVSVADGRPLRVERTSSIWPCRATTSPTISG